MARRKVISTSKFEIIRVAADCFFTKGVSETSPRMIADALNMSTGNITYYFPSKEHLLSVFTEILCDFQQKMVEREASEGRSSVVALCLEFAIMAAMCEEDEIIKDFYHSTYVSDLCLEIIQGSDIRRAKKVFAEYCTDWTDEKFAEAETIVSGVEYTTLKTNKYSPPLETRIRGALHLILGIYQVPQELREKKIEQVLNMDYRAIGRRMITDFKGFVHQYTDHAFDAMIEQIRKSAAEE